MPRTYTEDEWELTEIPRLLAYEESWFNHPRMDAPARLRHAALLERQTKLQERIRRDNVADRWVMRKLNRKVPVAWREPSPLTDMGMDEVIEAGKIVDKGID